MPRGWCSRLWLWLPVSQPYLQRDVEELLKQRDVDRLSPFYLDLQDEVLRIQVWPIVLRRPCPHALHSLIPCSRPTPTLACAAGTH